MTNLKIISGPKIPKGFVDLKRSSLTEMHLRTSPVSVSNIFINNKGGIQPVTFKKAKDKLKIRDGRVVNERFPHLESIVLQATREPNIVKGKKIGVLFSGGPASGGNNVVAGIKKALGNENTLYGFKNGPDGLIRGNLFEVTNDNMAALLNTGGFDFLGTSRTKIDKAEKIEQALQVVIMYDLDVIVVIGGDDSNTNAAELAEFFAKKIEEGVLKKKCTVIGAPKTIDGDLQETQNNLLPISFGFHTATRVYAKQVGNLLTDAASQGKYWFFCKMMGRSASHISLEVALQTRPHITLISEEIGQKQWSFNDVATYMTEIVARRAAKGQNYGVAVIPEGVINFIPESEKLIKELNQLASKHVKIRDELEVKKYMDKQGNTNWNTLGEQGFFDSSRKLKIGELKDNVPELQQYNNEDIDFVLRQSVMTIPEKKEYICGAEELQGGSKSLFSSFPDFIIEAMLLERDEHWNFKVSPIPTEKLLMKLVAEKFVEMQENPEKFNLKEKLGLTDEEIALFCNKEKSKFSPQDKFMGYEGRCGAPTRFDAAYSFNIGLTAGSLALGEHTGYMASIANLVSGGRPIGIPLAALIHFEVRKGKETPVIAKALVELDSPALKVFLKNREQWAEGNSSRSPGGVQHDGALAYKLPYTVALNEGIYSWQQIEDGKEVDFDLGARRIIEF